MARRQNPRIIKGSITIENNHFLAANSPKRCGNLTKCVPSASSPMSERFNGGAVHLAPPHPAPPFFVRATQSEVGNIVWGFEERQIRCTNCFYQKTNFHSRCSLSVVMLLYPFLSAFTIKFLHFQTYSSCALLGVLRRDRKGLLIADY